jgi:hypothetical protein
MNANKFVVLFSMIVLSVETDSKSNFTVITVSILKWFSISINCLGQREN